MKRPTRNHEGMYEVKGKEYPELFGSRTQVMNENAYKTTGCLVKDDLMMNKHGRIVSKRKHNTAKRENRLVKAGYVTKKGTFGFIKKDKKMKGGRHSRRKRGGIRSTKKKRNR